MATSHYISLFSGAGGLDLALRIAEPDARCVAYCEREGPAAAILAARMGEGVLDAAPIWSDVRTFPCELYRGRVAGIVGGFPCTDLSVAGRQAGITGEHSGLWFEYARLIREIQPRWVFIENVPPVLHLGNGSAVLGELAACGFDAEWLSIRASDVGAPHRRERVFIYAWRPVENAGYAGPPRRPRAESGSCAAPDQAGGPSGNVADASSERRQQIAGSLPPHEGTQARPNRESCRNGELTECPGEDVADVPIRGQRERGEPSWRGGLTDGSDKAVANPRNGQLQEPRRGSEGRDGSGPAGAVLGNAEDERHEWSGAARERGYGPASAGPRVGQADSEEPGLSISGRAGGRRAAIAGSECDSIPLFPPGPGDFDAWRRILAERPDLAPATQPEVCQLAHGLASRLHQLRAIGNGVVSLAGAVAYRILKDRAEGANMNALVKRGGV